MIVRGRETDVTLGPGSCWKGTHCTALHCIALVPRCPGHMSTVRNTFFHIVLHTCIDFMSSYASFLCFQSEVALKNMRGFRENMGKKVFVEGIEVEFDSLGTSLAVWITRSELSSSVSLGSVPLGLFRESLSAVSCSELRSLFLFLFHL